MKTILSIQLLVAAMPFVFGHGIIENPAPRLAGKAMKAACGEQVYNNQASDSGGNIQGIMQVAASQKDYDPGKCNIALCKGYQFQDNTANVQTYSPGQTIPIKVAIKAPHTGVANVSIVDTKTNAVIGKPLIKFDDYASNAHSIPADHKAFSITMPQDMGGKCGAAGDCVIQWFWDAPDIKQTYESCIDFKTGVGEAPAPPAGSALSKRQIMETMSNGPKTTLGISTMPMSSGAVETGKASSTTAGAASATAGEMPGMTMSSNGSTNYKAGVWILLASCMLVLIS